MGWRRRRAEVHGVHYIQIKIKIFADYITRASVTSTAVTWKIFMEHLSSEAVTVILRPLLSKL